MSIEVQPLPEYKFQVSESADIFETKKKSEAKLAEESTLSSRICRIAWNIFSVIIFPVGIARLIIAGVKRLVSAAILPAAFLFKAKDEELQSRRNSFFKWNASCAEQVTIRTADGADLDNYVIKSKSQQDLPPAQQKWVVFFNGNAMCVENDFDNLSLISKEAKVNVLSGNYRGVGRSTGRASSSDDLVLDGEALVQYLLNQGVEPRNILLHGLSLGGGVAAAVAANHQEEGREINLCSDRSFASITDFLKAHFPSWLSFVGTLLSRIVAAAKWAFDSLSNYLKIKGGKFIIYAPKDGIVTKPGSLYKKLKETAKAEGVADYKPDNALKLKLDVEKVQSYCEMQIGMVPSEAEILRNQGQIAHGIPLNFDNLFFAQYVNHVQRVLNIPI